MAFGGVATGSIKAQLAAMAAGINRTNGFCPMLMARDAIIGKNAAAVAVLLVNSVSKINLNLISLSGVKVKTQKELLGNISKQLMSLFLRKQINFKLSLLIL